MTTMIFSPVLGWLVPSFNLLVIALVGASLPTAFFFWMKWWLSSEQDENPDRVIAEQAKADAEHIKHHGGHGHDDGHHTAHA